MLKGKRTIAMLVWMALSAATVAAQTTAVAGKPACGWQYGPAGCRGGCGIFGPGRLTFRPGAGLLDDLQAELRAGDWGHFLGGRKVKAAYLGVATSPIGPALRKQLDLPEGIGLLVDHADPDGPAGKAGVETHDVLHKLNDQLLISFHQLAVLVRTFKPGEEVKLTVIRAAKSKVIPVKLVEKELPRLAGAPDADVLRWLTPPGRRRGPFATGVRRGTVRLMTPGRKGHSLSVTTRNGKKHLQVRDNKTGKVVWSGPIDTPEQRKAVPKEFRKQLERIDKAVRWEKELASPQMRAIRLIVKDGEHTLDLTARDDTKHLVAKDAAGKVMFDGPVETDAQRRKIPGEILKKLERMEKSIDVKVSGKKISL